MIVGTLVVLALAQQPADSARGRPCVIAIDSMPRGGQNQQNYYGGGGVRAHCQGTHTTLASDSIAYYAGLARFDMVGHVKIRDTTIALDANLASYYTKQERLDAHNNVVAVNRDNHSTLRGPNLTYYRAVPGVRDTMEMFASQRPTIEYHGSADSTEPYIIVADRVRFKGSDRMWGGGQVTIDRSDLAAKGDSMSLDQTTGLGVLVGSPSVTGKGENSYTLVGTRIELGLNNREVNLVKALGNGKATGSDWTLTADTIHLHVSNRKLQQAFAWGDSSRAHAVSTTNTITADSLAMDVPDQILTEARAYRKAVSTSKRDSTSAESERDWIAGDILTARWRQLPDSTGTPRTVLHRVISLGKARAFTHLYPSKTDTTAKSTAPSINYSRGDTIVIVMKAAKIDTVLVTGHADGVQVDPLPPPQHPDSTKQRPDSTKHPVVKNP